MMIRQNYKQEILPSAGMMGPDEQLLLSCRVKAVIMRPVDGSVRPLSRNNRLSHTPGLHLPTAPASSSPLNPSSSSSPYSSSPVLPEEEEEEEGLEREAENLPPRRPLKLAPLELPLEVKEAQWLKMGSVQQEVRTSGRKLDSAGGEGGEPCPRKVKACGSDRARSPARPPLTTIINPSKLQQRANRAHLLPVSQCPPGQGGQPNQKEADNKERNHIPAAKSAHLCSTGQSAHSEQTTGQSAHSEQTIGQSAHSEQTIGQSAHSEQTIGQSAHTEQTTGQSAHSEQTIGQSAHTEQTTGQSGQAEDGGCRRRPRLRRAQRLEEDQSRSGSFTAGLAAEEERKPVPAWTGPSQRSTEKALREASRVLERVSRRNPPAVPQQPRLVEKFSSRRAVYDIQEVAL